MGANGQPMAYGGAPAVQYVTVNRAPAPVAGPSFGMQLQNAAVGQFMGGVAHFEQQMGMRPAPVQAPAQPQIIYYQAAGAQPVAAAQPQVVYYQQSQS
jgi:hypothetical protein